MQKIGLFFGTFDPIHIGHEKIAKYFLNKYFDEVWFVITPLNPDKVNENLTDQSIRLEMTQKYCDNELDFKYSDIEFGLPKPNYTADTLYEFKRNYKNLNFSITKGEKVCIIGKSGSGKTTLLDILLGFVKIKSGEFFYNNNLVNDKNLELYRKIFSYIPQGFFIIKGS